MEKLKKYTIAIDALHMLCYGNITIIEDDIAIDNVLNNYEFENGIALKRAYKFNHPNFNFCFKIIIENASVGHLYFNDKGKYRYGQDDVCELRFENHILYQSGVADKINAILYNLQLHFYKFHYMEIAVDGHGIIAQHRKLAYSKTFKRKRYFLLHPTFDERIHTNIAFRIGSSASDKIISMYDKTDEINNSSFKHYIYEFWKSNGLNVNQKIDRCELRLMNKALSDFSADFNNLENPDYLASYYKESAGHWLEFYKCSNKKFRQHVVDWSQFESIEIVKQLNVVKAINLNKYKSTIHRLFEEFLITQQEQYLFALSNITARYKMLPWLVSVLPRWLRES